MLHSTGLSARTKPFSNFHIHEDREYFPALSIHEICDKEGKGQIAALFPEVGQLFSHVALCRGLGGNDQKVLSTGNFIYRARCLSIAL